MSEARKLEDQDVLGHIGPKGEERKNLDQIRLEELRNRGLQLIDEIDRYKKGGEKRMIQYWQKCWSH